MVAIIGSEAIASGALTRGQLRWNYVAVHPDVYLPRGSRRDIATNAHAAWLWTARRGIVAGEAAAAIHGVDSIPRSTPIEMIAGRSRRRPGVVVRRERIDDDEVEPGWIPLTTPARTALDLARRLPRNAAVAALDGLAGATGVCDAEISALVDRYRGARGMARVHEALHLVDGGTRCAMESRVRLILHDAGFPRPRTNIVLRDGNECTTMGMGWDGPRVGVSYYEDDDDGADPYRIAQHLRRQELVQRLGWLEICVAAVHTRASVIFRARRALRQRGS